jgi:hypothetical protein
MHVIKVNIDTRSLKVSPKFRPKAIPGFSTKVISKTLLTTGILCPGSKPFILMPRSCIVNPLTKIFET